MRYESVSPKTYGIVNNITATYQGNQIASLRDDAANVLLESSLDMPHGEWSGSDFAYDRNGNQTRDLSRGVSDIQYNELNLPERVEMDGGGSIEYLYSAAGTKLAEIVRDEDDQIINRRDYAGMFEYEADSIVRMALASGYVTVADTVYHLYAPDYQGNIVAVYNTATGQQEHYKDYYPYGLPHAEMPQSSSILPGLNPGLGSGLGPIIITPTDPETETPSTNRRWYGVKELTTDRGLNTYDFEARHLAPAFPRFTTPDPLGEENLHITLYSMCNGDPINFVDPTGMFSWGNFWGGILKIICGGIEAIGGAAACSTGVGAIPGGLAVLHGSDMITAGFMQIFHDEDVPTLTNQLIQQTGVSENTANIIEDGLSITNAAAAVAATATAKAVSTTAVVRTGSSSTAKIAATEIAETPQTLSPVSQSKIGATGAYCEAQLAAEVRGDPHHFFRTDYGARFVDNYSLATRAAHESKVGYTPLKSFVKTQVNKDIWLLNNSEVKSVTWHFYTSPITGKIGPSIPLQNQLNQAGISIVYHF